VSHFGFVVQSWTSRRSTFGSILRNPQNGIRDPPPNPRAHTPENPRRRWNFYTLRGSKVMGHGLWFISHWLWDISPL